MAIGRFTGKRKRCMATLAGTAALAVGVGAAATACGSETESTVSVNTAFSPASAATTAKAVTYNPALVPEKSQVEVKEELRSGDATHIELQVKGLLANRTYGAHVHVKPCGQLPDDSGPHYQDKKDPKTPSTDPAYANSSNEVWLDFTTDKDGNGHAQSDVKWRFRTGGAHSVVIHDHATDTHTGHAGTAGPRLACVNVPFK
jgi:Cu-Zn family superoxide dismutase